MTFRNVLASVAVKDVDAAAAWYEKVLGPAGSKPMPEVAEWTFDGGGGLQVYQAPERAGQGSFTCIVTDLDRHAEQLRALGVDTSDRSDGERVRTLMVTDPDGNHIAFAEPSDPTLAQ